MTKALYRKWRPQNWDEVTAQEHIIQTLRNAVTNDRVAHAYLFAGPRGTGKTSTARLLAKAVNCLDPDLSKRPCNHCDNCLALNAGRFMDLIEIDAASNTSVDDVRDLRDKINFSPSQGKFKVYIIDEVHMLSTAAFNALLKTLEEPPPHAIFVLATTEIHKIPATVLSRCQRHEFRRISINDIVLLLKEKSQEEGLHVAEQVFHEIARQATGSLRDAISLLDQLTSTSDEISLDVAQEILGTATSKSVIDIVEALKAKDAKRGLSYINTALNSGSDPRQLARQIVSYLRSVLLIKMENPDLVDNPEVIQKQMFEHANQMALIEIVKGIETFNQATSDEHANWHPGLGLELAFTSYLIEPETKVSHSGQEVIQAPKSASTKTLTAKKPQTTQVTSPQKKSENTPTVKKAETKLKDSDIAVDHDQLSQQKPPQKQTRQPQKGSILTESREPESNKIKVTSIPHEKGKMPSLIDIQRSWEQIKLKVKEFNARTTGLLNSCKIVGLRDNVLILGFTTDTLKAMMEKEGNINLLSDILTEFSGIPMSVNCIVTSTEDNGLPHDLQFDHDGMVSAATRDLGGKISNAQKEK